MKSGNQTFFQGNITDITDFVKDKEKKEKELEIFVKEFFKSIEDENVEMYGPMKSLVYRVKDRFRYNIFIKGSKKNISMFKRKLNKKLIDYKKSDDFRIVVDVDPINLI